MATFADDIISESDIGEGSFTTNGSSPMPVFSSRSDYDAMRLRRRVFPPPMHPRYSVAVLLPKCYNRATRHRRPSLLEQRLRRGSWKERLEVLATPRNPRPSRRQQAQEQHLSRGAEPARAAVERRPLLAGPRRPWNTDSSPDICPADVAGGRYRPLSAEPRWWNPKICPGDAAGGCPRREGVRPPGADGLRHAVAKAKNVSGRRRSAGTPRF